MSTGQSLSMQIAVARNATLILFAANGFVIASWMSRLPDIKALLNLTAGQLGIMLLAISVGALVGLPLAGRISDALGAKNAARVGIVVSIAGILFASIAVQAAISMYLIMPGLFFFGMGNGVWDVAQNLEGTEVEQAQGKSIMPWFHAGFSGGTVIGALVGALVVWLSIPVLPHLIGVVIVAVIGAWWATSVFLPRSADEKLETEIAADHAAGKTGKVRSAWLEPRTLIIGVMVMAAAFTEGTANDWMAVAFVDGHGVSKTAGVLALAVFLTAMTVGRLTGTYLLDCFGRLPVLYLMFAAAILGSLMVIFGNDVVAFAGAAVWGLGSSLGFPVGMSAAADDPARAPMRISVVATIGYTAFLAGPPVLGFLGDHFGILHALLLVSVMSLAAMLAIPAAKPLPEAAGVSK